MEFKSNFNKLVMLIFMVFLGLNLANASGNVIDVAFSENVFELVNYDPLGITSGTFADTYETQSIYTITGTVVIKNTHSTEAVENVVINLSQISNVSNFQYNLGVNGFVTEFNKTGDYVILTIPDLGPGKNSTFTYIVNATNIAPPINFTTSYADSKIFASLPLSVVDRVSNTLNSGLYSDTCVYNINITQRALTMNSSGTLFNFTFVNTTMGGADSTNASFADFNRTINWNLWNLGCFNSGNSTNLSYDVLTPTGVTIAKSYSMINTTTKYSLNTTISRIKLSNINAFTNLNLGFEKYQNNTLNGDNATWQISGNITSPSNITVNLTSVTFWVSKRNGTGTGFTNPSIIDNDTISGSALTKNYPSGILLNNSLTGWNNAASNWYFNYTYSSSPIVWMDAVNNIVNDGVQISNRSISYGDNSVYIKDIYLATGYWIKITKNITRLADNNYSIFIKVTNLGTSSTPSNQAVIVYNFIPIAFNLTSAFVFSSSTWYTTINTSQVLTDNVYNGTMHQFAIMANGNIFNSSLKAYGGTENSNNTWSVLYNTSGSGQFNFEDLFLTGVDPLNVGTFGATKSLSVESMYNLVSSKFEYLLIGVAASIGALLLLL